MNSYGDPQSARARARVPGPSSASAPDDDLSRYDYDEPRPGPDAYRRGSAGRASVSGAVPRGAAAVGGANGRASVGAGTGAVGAARARASVGSASVGRPNDDGPGYGSRGISARASVRPVSPAVGMGGPGEPPGGDPNPRRGSAGKILAKAAKKRRRANILTASAAVLVILAGVGVVAGTWFFDGVDTPNPVSEDQANVILDSDGNVLAKLGEQNRTVVPEQKINEVVEHAVAAAEDKNFYHHHGIDMKGIARAAWNNFTGGDTQGASTITQQYARHAADLKGISYNRKLREAVIARKLESKYNKDQIMGMYLNYIDLGEGRYGIEAAAQGYFKKSVLTPAGSKNAITPYEAAVLASIIKQPYPTATHKGYDPNYNPVDAKARWEYTMKNMLDEKWISQAEYDARKYPKVQPRNADTCKTCAADKPVGMIIRHVKAELAAANIDSAEFEKGGLTITTTIDPGVQKAAEEAGSRGSKESPMHGRPKSYQAAVIGIDPNTGRVLGYYGGDNPVGTDYAGYMSGDGTEITGGQSPGSSAKIYTLAAALKEDISFKTRWDGTLKRPNGTAISNAGADPGSVCSDGGGVKSCDLETATIHSYNFPFYWIADKIGRDKVISAAVSAGLKHMFNDDGKMIDLADSNATTWEKNFDNEVAFGQYRVVPLEHAEGVATVVNGGVHHAAHFIESVKQVDAETGTKKTIYSEKVAGNRVFAEDQMANLDGVLAKIVSYDNRDLNGGRESIAKSGTWEYKEGSGDCWFVGGIPQLAATVWVGGAGNKVELKETNGRDMFGAGTPSRIWKKFLDASAAALDMKKEDFPPRVETGNPNSSFANGQALPVETPQDNNQNCVIQIFCQDNNNGNNDNNGNNNNGNNNGNNNNGNNNVATTAPTVTPTDGTDGNDQDGGG